jgi:hypothetical protein
VSRIEATHALLWHWENSILRLANTSMCSRTQPRHSLTTTSNWKTSKPANTCSSPNICGITAMPATELLSAHIQPLQWSSRKLPLPFRPGSSSRRYSLITLLEIPNEKILPILATGPATKCFSATAPLAIWWSTSTLTPQPSCQLSSMKRNCLLIQLIHAKKDGIGRAVPRKGTDPRGSEWRQAVDCAI